MRSNRLHLMPLKVALIHFLFSFATLHRHFQAFNVLRQIPRSFVKKELGTGVGSFCKMTGFLLGMFRRPIKAFPPSRDAFFGPYMQNRARRNSSRKM